MLNHVNSYESLRMFMQSAAEARSYFEDTPGVTVVEIPINDGWARDWGPSVSCIPSFLSSVFPFPVAYFSC